MSYSRWSDSFWYTYWGGGDTDKIEDQTFVICTDGWFTYQQLEDDLEGCLDKIRVKTPRATEEEFQELKSYMVEFLLNMNKQKERGRLK